MKVTFLISTILIVVFAASCSAYKSKKDRSKTTFTIGSGSKSAMYYPVAVALCEVFNKHNQDKSIVCKAKLSKGAEYNLDAVENGEFDMGIAQANLQYDAYIGSEKFLNNPHKNLRTLFNLHHEYLTIIAKKDSNIYNFSDLRGKKVNAGNPGSGSRILFSQMIAKLGWNLSDFKEIYEESGSNINNVLCAPDKADAAVYIVGHPNESFQLMLEGCNTKLVSLTKTEVDLFSSLSPINFHKTYIPEKIYENNPDATYTFATKTILTATANLDSKIVQNFVKIISENKEELIKKQPSLAVIDFSTQDDPKLAPLHQGLKNIQ